MFGLRYRDLLPQAVRDEFENLVAALNRVIGREHNRDGSHVTPAWTKYQPTFLNPTVLGNGAMEGWYLLDGQIVHYSITVVIGSTTVVPTVIGITLPFRSRGFPEVFSHLGAAIATINGSPYGGIAQVDDTFVRVFSDLGEWGSSVPDTWGSGDFLRISGQYAIATQAPLLQ